MEITDDNLPEFKAHYDNAVVNKEGQFVFQGAIVLTAYAKYLLEYIQVKQLEQQGHGREMNN